jgi:hypothetical protein
MAPRPSRVLDDLLVLRTRGGDRVLSSRFEALWYADQMPSQRRFQVSPDARVLAHLAPGATDLHVQRRDGTELVVDVSPSEDLRFSPDGSELAVVRYLDNEYRVDRLDLRAMELRAGPTVDARPEWMEYCERGLLVSHAAEGNDGAISLLAPGRPPEPVARTTYPAKRFTAASRGTRFVYVDLSNTWSVDGPGGTPRKVDARVVYNIELSPDGRALAVVDGDTVVLFEGDAEVKVWRGVHAHSLWFLPSGALAWASNDEVVTWDGRTESRLSTPDSVRIAAMRPVRGGTGLVLVRGKEVVWWNPELERETVLAEAEPARSLVGADLFAGGVVMWLTTPSRQ